MRGFLFGLLVGGAVGAGTTWYALTMDGAGGEVAVVVDAGSTSEDDGDGKRRPRRKRRKRGDDSAYQPVVLSPADREMIWRGPKPELATREVDLGAGGGGRTLDAGEIQRGIAQSGDAMVACVTEARGDAEGLSGELTVEALVEADGRVSDVRVRAPRYLIQRGLGPCVQRAARSMSFPATGAQTIITIPLNLR